MIYKIFILFCFMLFARFVRADYITQNVSDGCASNLSNIYAIYSANQYNCGAGYYVPANHDGCVVCPAGSICVGGTYSFNETMSQGMERLRSVSVNVNYGCDRDLLLYSPSLFFAQFTPNQHTCATGYYMPANYDGCQLCPTNNYCGGGTYTFNENLAQGIASCASGLFAPTGMWESAQCGRILHIGDQIVYLRATKKTTPSVNVDIDNDGVADFFGNMTTLDVPMTNGTQRKLKLSYGGQTYSVYDDSVDLTGYQN